MRWDLVAIRQNVRVSFDRRSVLRYSLSVAIPVGGYGAVFGAAAVSSGFSVLQACVLSLFLFSGASQFAVVGVMGAGGSVISAIATGALLGVRNSFYGLRMSPILQISGVRKLIDSHITIDESTGVAISQENLGKDAMRYAFYVTGLGVFFFWNLFTLLGALSANSIGNPATFGLDAAVPAAFLGLIWPRLTTKETRIAALISILVALLLTPILPPGIPIIATVLIAVFMGWNAK